MPLLLIKRKVRKKDIIDKLLSFQHSRTAIILGLEIQRANSIQLILTYYLGLSYKLKFTQASFLGLVFPYLKLGKGKESTTLIINSLVNLVQVISYVDLVKNTLIERIENFSLSNQSPLKRALKIGLLGRKICIVEGIQIIRVA